MPIKRHDGWRAPFVTTLGRIGLTFLVIFVLLLVSVFPLPGAHAADVRPAFILMAVYYWTIMWPATFTYFTTFLVGIAFDLLAGYPPGMHTVVLLLVQWVTRSQRKFMLGQPFRVIWAGLVLVAFVTAILQWALFSLFYGELITVKPVLVSALLTCALFPLAVPALSAFGRWIAQRSSLAG